ncbi:hypothetical protein ABBQ38_014271 [Trebouxia sp. C0009 RCD-2024]
MPPLLDKENVKMTDCTDCNVFQFCQFLKLLGKIMIILVLLIVGMTYYAVIIATAVPGLHEGGAGNVTWCLFVFVTFHFLIIMLLWSYFTAVATDPGRVPPGWHPFSDEEEAAYELERLNYASYQPANKSIRPRFCKKCQAWKPPRTHHDSMSGTCVLKMDHYCIWVLNCVGLLNYKAFLLFLAYTFLATLLATIALVNGFVQYFKELQEEDLEPSAKPAILFLAFVIDAAFALAIVGFLVMHCRMIARNMTTIEMYEKRRHSTGAWPFDRGAKHNFLEVFGRSRLRWFVPAYTKEEVRELLSNSLNSRPPDSADSAELALPRSFSNNV